MSRNLICNLVSIGKILQKNKAIVSFINHSYLKSSFSSSSCQGTTGEHAKCPRCGNELNCCCTLFCSSEQCLKVQKLDQTICNYYDLFNLGSIRYNVDGTAIDNNFRNLQKKIHPDKFVSKDDNIDKELSIQNSAFINKAHNVMKSPLDRAMYIVSIVYIMSVYVYHTV